MSSDLKVTNIKHESSASNNLVLASDGSATINQISSSSVFPAGHIINMEINHTGTQKTVTATSYAESSTTITALEVTIDKNYSSSKIWVLCSPSIQAYRNSAGNAQAGARIIRGTSSPYTEIKDFNCVVRSYDSENPNVVVPIVCLQCVDETSLTGDLTYKLELKKIAGDDARLNIDNNNDSISTISVFEVM